MSAVDTSAPRPVTIHNHTPCDLTIRSFDESDRLRWLSNESHLIKPTTFARVNALGLIYINLELSCKFEGQQKKAELAALRGRHYVIDLSHTGELFATPWNRPAPVRNAKTVAEEQPKKQPNSEQDDSIKCKICMESPINSLLLPCGHAVACDECLKRLPSVCPICRLHVIETKTIFWA
jgi:hypothetical protein